VSGIGLFLRREESLTIPNSLVRVECPLQGRRGLGALFPRFVVMGLELPAGARDFFANLPVGESGTRERGYVRMDVPYRGASHGGRLFLFFFLV